MSVKRAVMVGFAVSAMVAAMGPGVSTAATVGPGWTIDSYAAPTSFSSAQNAQCSVGGYTCDAYQVSATNAGSVATDGGTVTVGDTLPAGLTVSQIQLWALANKNQGSTVVEEPSGLCDTITVECQLPRAVAPDETVKMVIFVTVASNAPGELTNRASVSGGGAAEASTSETNANSSTPASFGVSAFDFYIDGPGGAQDTQAGDHPYEVTTTIGLNSKIREGPTGTLEADSTTDLKDVVVDLPLGFGGSTLAAPECTLSDLSGRSCPAETVVGHLLTEPPGATSIDSPIWNLVPEHGYPAEFGYIDGLGGSHVFYVRVVPTPDGYVLQTTNPDTPQINLTHIVATFFGDPAVRDGTSNAQIPFFTNPTGCTSGPLRASIHIDSWQNPGSYNADGTPNFNDPAWMGGESVSPPVTGCNALSFTPELKAQPTTTVADSPSGLEFELKLPQAEVAGTTATPALKTATVTLPEGMTVDPSSADGLGVCSEAQVGFEGPTLFDFSPAQPECPESSKIGSLELETPLIPRRLYGEMFLAAQNANPFHSTLAAYVIVNDPVTGVLIKLPGEFRANPTTGQITATFSENPQLPFSDLKLHFFGGPRAELATPPNCGLYTTRSELEPWSFPDSGPIATPFDDYVIDENCATAFNPAFEGGSTNLQAGAYSPFVGSFSRQDNEQELGGLTVSLPPGLLANVGSVPLCPEAQANAGTCPESSLVGTAEAGAGPGPNPLFVPGKIYLTGPYGGGPYGLSVVVPADPGPFNFGLVVVRQSIRIDPTDAHVIVVSNPFPTILDPVGADGQTNGIPIKLRRVDFDINRPGFTFNPTNCDKHLLGGAITSNQGASSTLAIPFQVTNCATLKFAPKFSVSTSGKTSRAGGANLSVKLTYPNAPFGSQANIAKVKVELPKRLPSRLTTLQKACTAAVFDSNPAGCPPASIVGHARASTPILPVPLEGPAYFVSHGGEAFPSLVMVLQGNGVRLDLVGSTFINKAGITSSTFKTVPDAPVGTFELTLPQGQFSALAANGNLCQGSLAMPTEFIAQNGAEIHESTKIAVTGCAKHKNKKTTHKRKAKRKRKGKK